MLRTLKIVCVFTVIAACLSVADANAAKKQSKKQGKPGVSLLKPDSLDGWGYFLVKEEGAEKMLPMTDVWSITKGVLSCKGVPMGYLSTEKTYENFKLSFQWRWPKDVEPTNSGVFVRITGEDRALPKCVEIQLQPKNAGDLIGFHGVTLAGPETDSVIQKESPIGGAVSILRKEADSQLPQGEWNKGKIVVRGDTITVWMNGKKVNEATGVPAYSGKIGLQSEGGPIEFRSVKVKELKAQKSSDNSLTSINGRVLLDGKPLDNCTIKFVPMNENTTGSAATKIDSQGSYRIASPKIKPGNYRIILKDLSPASNNDKASDSRIKPLYQSSATTPLTVTILPSSNTIDFKLKK